MITQQIKTITACIRGHAAIAPDEVAIVDGSSQLTYAALEQRSDALAGALQRAGAKSGQCVVLFLERSCEFVIAALAAWKSGAAFVPVDTTSPIERVATILKDANAVALVTDSRRASQLPLGAWRVLNIDSEGLAAVPFSAIDLDPSSLAYIIYTSGSTGEPKGVEITHAGLSNLIEWHQSAFAITTADRASQVANLGFDAAIWEIWPYLAVGATLLIADETTRRSWEALSAWIISEQITIGFVPTALAERLVQKDWPAETALRIMLTGGDTLRSRPSAGLPFVLVNNYGPTECTVVVTSGAVAAGPDKGELPSIGRPIAGATAIIVDEALRPVPAGQAGELCIGGVVLARGYHNLPHLTARQFVTYMAASGQPQRIYRTGDRARFLENGEIAFLGRMDDQVKIRGYRIEPAEIAVQLNRFPGIKESVIIVREMADSGRSLVAYIVAATEAHLTASALREFLATRLPDYMIPAFFVLIPELRTTATGKPDISALPTPTAGNLLPNRTHAHTHAAESDGLAQEISATVASMLGVPTVHPTENFFMIGGHSMLGMEIVARLRETYGVKLTLRQLFIAPTVSDLATEVAQLLAAKKRQN